MKHFWAKYVALSLAIGVMPMSICAQESINNDGEIEAYNQSDEGYWFESNGRWKYYYYNMPCPSGGSFRINDDLYLFDKDGWMQTNCWYHEVTPYENQILESWSYFDADGRAHRGWFEYGSNWYYFDEKNWFMYSDTRWSIGGDYYLFTKSGAMYTGWDKDGSNWYYYNDNGKLYKGWLHYNDKWYYMSESDGTMLTDCVVRENENRYYINPDGTMYTGWHKENNSWYYYNAYGKAHKGWFQEGDKWYYMDPNLDGLMVRNQNLDIDGNEYKFNDSGTMFIGWYTKKGIYGEDLWYYYRSDGALQKGWLQIGDSWYYFDENDGHMISSARKLMNGNYYHFKKDGTMASGWYSYAFGDDSSVTYYCGVDGKEYHGWLEQGGKWYYFDPTKGVMYQNKTVYIDGTEYTFNADGSLQS